MEPQVKQFIDARQKRILAELDSLPGRVRMGDITQDGADKLLADLNAERNALQRMVDEAEQ